MQMDFLEHAAVDDVIVMGVVLEEVRHRNASAYQRLRALVDSPARRFFVFVNEHHRCAAPVSGAAHPMRTHEGCRPALMIRAVFSQAVAAYML